MEKQVLNIKQMQHLKELGLDTSSASMYWHKITRTDTGVIEDDWYLDIHPSVNLPSFISVGRKTETIPTFTLQDILDLLPSEIEENSEHNLLSITNFNDDWYIRYQLSDEFEPLISFESKSLLDAAYKMLCWCIEKGYIKTKED